MYFELYKVSMYPDVTRTLVARGRDVLNEINFKNELMYEPTIQLELPLYYSKYISGREELKLYFDDKCFWGIITDHNEDTINNKLSIELTHAVYEWRYRQISVNNAVKDKSLEFVYVENASSLVRDETTGESIAANSIKVEKTIWETITDEQIITQAQARAWTTATSEFITVHLEKKKKKEDSDTEWYLKFYTDKGTHVTTSCSVYEKKEDEEEKTDEKDIQARVVDQLGDIESNINFVYPGWDITFEGDTASRGISYVYSRQNKLDALTKTCELTPDVYWRVGFEDTKHIIISTFGEKKGYILSTKPQGKYNIQMLDEPTIDNDYKKVVNLASVYSSKSDGGANTLTLREVYNDKSLQDSNFPVYIIRTAQTSNVNNERNYKEYVEQYPTLASNNELEYAILDTESVALESGTLIEGTFAFNDLNAFNVDNADGDTKTITDEDRKKASLSCYHTAIKKLKNLRRSYKITVPVKFVPVGLNVGDQIRCYYDKSVWSQKDCPKYFKKLIDMNDWYYIESISYNSDKADEITLSKFLQVPRYVEVK